MSAGTQLTVENMTPQKRRFFILWSARDPADAEAIALSAWQSFLLAPGDIGYSAAAGIQLAARSQLPDAQPQTTLIEAELGTGWRFQLDEKGAPEFVPADRLGQPGSIAVENRTSGDALLRYCVNFSPIWHVEKASPHAFVEFAFQPTLFFYVSVAVVDEEQPIVIEPTVGQLLLDGSAHATARFRQNGGTREWQIG